MIKKILLSISFFIILNSYAYARLSTHWEDSGSGSGGILPILIVVILFVVLFMWEKYKESRPDKYNIYTGEKHYVKPKKKKSLSGKLIKIFNVQTLDKKKKK